MRVTDHSDPFHFIYRIFMGFVVTSHWTKRLAHSHLRPFFSLYQITEK